MTPGNRLRRARKLNGFNKRTGLCEHLQSVGCHISYPRIGRLERDEDNPTIEEIVCLCAALKMSSDWWLIKDAAPQGLIVEKIQSLPSHHRQTLLNLIDMLVGSLD